MLIMCLRNAVCGGSSCVCIYDDDEDVTANMFTFLLCTTDVLVG